MSNSRLSKICKQIEKQFVSVAPIPRGRPRVWASENERNAAKQRAYRERLKQKAALPNVL
jgi:hypothetical protein